MRHRNIGPVISLLIFLSLTMVSSGSIEAQSLWLQHSHRPSFSVEVLKPKYGLPAETNLLHMNFYISAYIPIASRFSLSFELPYTNFSFEDFDNNTGSMGNIYAGIEYDNPQSILAANFGVRIPIASENHDRPLLYGVFTDPDRIEAFTTKRLNFYGSGIFKGRIDPHVSIRTGIGPMLSVATGSDSDRDTEFYLRYYSQLWFEPNRFSMAMGLTGLFLLSEDDLNFGERTFHHLGLTAFYGFDKVKPGIILLFPLDSDFSDIIDVTYGFSLTIGISDPPGSRFE